VTVICDQSKYTFCNRELKNLREKRRQNYLQRILQYSYWQQFWLDKLICSSHLPSFSHLISIKTNTFIYSLKFSSLSVATLVRMTLAGVKYIWRRKIALVITTAWNFEVFALAKGRLVNMFWLFQFTHNNHQKRKNQHWGSFIEKNWRCISIDL